jgi:vacuolar-type H+-ATPase subunit H
MKQSLISEVESIEQEASKLVEKAKQVSEKAMLNVSKAMDEARDAISAKASATSEQIIEEHVRQAEEDAHKIIKESKDAVGIIHTTADKNRDMAITKASQLFADEFNVSLD